MTEDIGRTFSPDLVRLGKRLKKYIHALEKITTAMFFKEEDEPIDDEKIDRLLKKTLPYLQEAFDSNTSLIADENGAVVYTIPEGSDIVGALLTEIPSIKSAIKKENSYIKDDQQKSHHLDALKLFSLILVKLETPVGVRYIGVANSQNDPPYIGADKQLMDELMKTLKIGLDYGKFYGQVKEERSHFQKRFIQAQNHGDWEFLATASEDYFKSRLKSKNVESDDITQKLRKEFDNDTILKDYLDAQLWNFIRDTLPRVKDDKPTERLFREINSFIRKLDSNELKKIDIVNAKKGRKWEINHFPKTALAAARMLLFTDYYKDETAKRATISGQLWDVARKILNKTDTPDKKNFLQWRLDFVRTKWQQIYYLSLKGIQRPKPEKLKEINKICIGIWGPTIKIIKEYLESKQGKDGLYIDSDWLLSWLGSNVLLSKRLKEHYDLVKSDEKKALNPIAKMRYLNHLSHLMLYVLHCVRFAELEKKLSRIKQKENFKRPPFADILVDVTSSLTEAQLYIMSEYAYREIGVHRELRIFERLQRQLAYELPLHTTSNFYRDHLYHVMDVCLLGELLLHSMFSEEATGGEYEFFAETFTTHTASELFHNWYVAALCHDLGYVIEKADKFIGPIHKIRGPGLSDFSKNLKDGLLSGKNEIRKTIIQIVESKSYVIPDALARKLIEADVSTDHGVAGWLHLRQWIQETNYEMKTLAPALTAILRHNLSGQEVDLRKEPLTFLLMFCDHVQEWGRPRIGPESLAYGIAEGMRFSDEPVLSRKIRMSNIFIKGLKPGDVNHTVQKHTCKNCIQSDGLEATCKHKCLRVQGKVDKDKKIEFILPHIEASEADFEPCLSWLMFSRDLQSINYGEKNKPFDISIRMVHTPPRIWSALEWSLLEMDLFEEFANTHPKATYLCEWIAFARNNKEGIEYIANRKEGTETFIIKLHELGKPLKRDLTDEQWKDFPRWKWQWLRQKYTTANLGPWFLENDS